MTSIKFLSLYLIGFFLLSISSAYAGDLKPLPGQKSIRVCADGYNMPYSDKSKKGFDNRIAELLGKEMGLPVEFYWFPQRLGFSRNTIKKVDPKTGLFKCDVAMSVPADTDFIKPTKPYWKSIETIIYRKNSGYKITSIADIAKVNKSLKKPLRIGLFDRSMGTAQIIKLGLADQITYYQMMPGDATVNAGRIVKDIANNKIDVALLWGPIAGYYASISKVPVTVQPINELGQRYVFSFSMGTRYKDKKWNALLNKFIDENHDKINAILADYHFPSLKNVSPTPKKEVRKGDDD